MWAEKLKQILFEGQACIAYSKNISPVGYLMGEYRKEEQ